MYLDENCVTREVKELSLLLNITQMLNESLDLANVMNPILRMVADNMNITRCALTILNRKTGEIMIEESVGLRTDEREKGRYLVGEGITGKVVDTGKMIIVPQISKEPQFLNKTGSRKIEEDTDVSFICVPVKTGSEVIGTLSIDRKYEGETTLGEAARLLSIIASCMSQAVRLRQLAQERVNKVEEENRRLLDELKLRNAPKNIVGNSKIMRGLYAMVEKVSAVNTTVLILGESGVGKEMVAKAIHYGSNRADRPFIKFNCAAIPESLIESELFGHEKGAFTGANSQRKGRFEQADGGTIFLDEIGEIPPSIQTKLLRVLQEREIERIGGNETIHVDVRILAATNRDLDALMSDGKFREDLYYRLNVFPIVVPPLRERKTDIILLADYFIEKFSAVHGKPIFRMTTRAVDMMMAYHWPGNVRELENCIERAVLLSSDSVIHSYNLPPSIQSLFLGNAEFKGTLNEAVEKVEKETIVEHLRLENGNITRASQSLGVTERILGLRIRKYRINPKDFKKNQDER